MYERERAGERRRPETRPPQRHRRKRRRRRGFGGLLVTTLAVAAAFMLLHSALKMPPEDAGDADLPAKGQPVIPISLSEPGAKEPSGDTGGAPKVPDVPDIPDASVGGDRPDGQTEDPLDPQVPQLPKEPEEPKEPGSTPSADDWNLMLVNPWNAMPEDYTINLEQLSSGHSVDQRCYDALQDMLGACRAAGLQPVICSSYRTWDKQESLYQNKVNRLMNQGYSQADALVEAGKVVAVPGTSEHQLGLAVDIVDVNNQNLDESQEKTAVQKWLMEHSYEYGFILRYPNNKSELTGIIYEPWHYRYVGKEAAAEIFEQGVCLEEYLEGLGS